MTLGIISLVFLLYLLGLAYLGQQWGKGLSQYRPGASSGSSYSILIPFRNESKALLELVENLVPQLGPEDEIILVDDHSDNELAQQLRSHYLPNKQVVLLALGDGELGKKSALKAGFLKSKTDFIVQLDADVEVGPGWLQGIKEIPSSVDLGILPVSLIDVRHEFKRLEYSEFMSIAGVTGAMATMGKAAMANGANLLVRKTLMQEYFDAGKDQNISSGDDMFLLGIAKRKRANIKYCFDTRIIVHARGNQSLRDYIDQRVRWASKMLHGTGLPGRGLGLAIALFQVFFIASLIYFLSTANASTFVLLFGIKGIGEFLFCKKVSHFFGFEEWLDHFSIPGVMLYPFISLFAAFASMVYRPKWKGRIIEVKS